MRVRRVLTACIGTLLLVVGPVADSAMAASTLSHQCSTEDYNGDPRLGPRDLPTSGSVGYELRTYDRFGGLTPDKFIATWWDPAANAGNGGWRFPPFNGFLVGPDGQPRHTVMTLRVGSKLDRYGSEFGGFLAPIGSLYSQRAIPPQSLDNSGNPASCNYLALRVIREFKADGGPIAPAFGQPGQGLQYRLDGSLVPGAPALLNVRWLIDNGYLARCAVVPAQPYTC